MNKHSRVLKKHFPAFKLKIIIKNHNFFFGRWFFIKKKTMCFFALHHYMQMHATNQECIKGIQSRIKKVYIIAHIKKVFYYCSNQKVF